MAAAVRKTNWFAIWVTVAVVVVVVAVAGVVIAMNNKASGNAGTKPESAHINTDTGAISFGTAKNTMDTYIDLMCPICQAFETQYGPDMQKLVADKTMTLNVHPISILDGSSNGTKYSTRAASDVYSVAVRDYAKTQAFITALYENQPKEGSSGLTDQQLIDLAKKAGVNMTSDLQNDFTKHTYADYVTYMTPKTPIAPGSNGIGTPTIAINGEAIALSTLPAPAQLSTLFK